MYKLEFFELSSFPPSFRNVITIEDRKEALKTAMESSYSHVNVWENSNLIYCR